MKAEIELCDVCGKRMDDNDVYVLSLVKRNIYPPVDSTLVEMCNNCRKKYLKELNKTKKLRIKWQVVQ